MAPMHEHTHAPTAPAELPRGWSIRVTFTANAAVLTLLSDEGTPAHISFGLGFTEREPLTVTALDEVHDAALRAAAEAMLAAYAERLAAVERAIAEFNRQLPPAALARLDADLAAQQIALEVDVDSDALALEVRLDAAGVAAGALLSLVNRWRRESGAPTEQITEELADGALCVHLPQAAGIHLLTWLSRRRPTRRLSDGSAIATMQE